MSNRRKNRILRRALFICLILLLMFVPSFAEDTKKTKPMSTNLRLVIDGMPVESDTAPYIYGERTMVPFRAIGETIGAVVGWDDNSKMATYQWRGQYVQVTLESPNAFVNGTWTELDEPAQLTNSRTFVPVRFVAESLGCEVDWDAATRTVIINTPSAESMRPLIQTCKKETDGSDSLVVIRASKPLENVTKTIRDGKLVICFQNTALSSNLKGLNLSDGSALNRKNAYYENAVFTYRPENYPEDIFLEMDLKREVAPRLEFSEDEKTLTIRFTPDTVEGTESAYKKAAEESGLPALDWRAAGNLVILDPGHGGRDSGSLGKLNGKTIYEKDINLTVAKKAKALLETAGVRVEMTREDDSFPILYTRPTLANTRHADLTVSIHNNSNSASRVSGTEVLYHVMEKEASYPVDSKILATNVYNEMDALLGMKGRGLVDNSDLALVNRCLMPSCIVEGAYMSNAGDIARIVTEDFQNKFALAVAGGIIKTLNESVR